MPLGHVTHSLRKGGVKEVEGRPGLFLVGALLWVQYKCPTEKNY